jgi:hypothetical protein
MMIRVLMRYMTIIVRKICRLSGLLLLTGCGIFSKQARLDRSWPVTYPLFSQMSLIPVRQAVIIKKNNDTLRGYVRMAVNGEYTNDTLKNIPFLPFTKKSKDDLIIVDIKDIDFLRIQIGLNDTATQDYRPLNSRMWQILGRNDRASLYYRKVLNKYGSTGQDAYFEYLVLLKDNWLIGLPPNQISPFAKPTGILRQFIRERYDENLQSDEFKTEKALIDHILANEMLDSTWRIPGPYVPFKWPG